MHSQERKHAARVVKSPPYRLGIKHFPLAIRLTLYTKIIATAPRQTTGRHAGFRP